MMLCQEFPRSTYIASSQRVETIKLRTVSKSYCLLLGDRACQALGIVKQLPVLTADRVWLNVPVQTEVRVIRG
jgi:PIN domain nuclease of toxin-antitoxin system